MGNFIDLTGQIIGRLTIDEKIEKNKNGAIQWSCHCICGQRHIVTTSNLMCGRTNSCGCLRNEKLIQRTIANAHLRKTCWNKEEDNILYEFYANKGSEYCSHLLNRTKAGVMGRVKKLNLKVNFASTTYLPKKNIIKELSKTKVISICKIHGETEHHYAGNKIRFCLVCRQIDREKSINRFVDRLRSSIKGAFKRIYEKNGGNRKVGAMRHLDYSGVELYNYLENIKKLQNNKCPHCQISYNECKISIDHVIPLITAKTEQEVIDLFDLKNLNLMCKNCNSSKNDVNYNVWMENKYGN